MSGLDHNAGVRIRVLGPTVVDDRADLPLRDRAVLGVLVLRVGSHAGMDELADAIWGERPPATYKKVVQGCVVRLRRELGEDAIATREGGYALTPAAGGVDADHFEQLVGGAQSALHADEPRRALDLAARALSVDGVATHRLVTPTDDPTALAFSPDGRYLAAGMSELGFAPTGATVVWDVATGRQVAAFDSGDGAVQAHVFAPDGLSIWSLGDDGIHQWDLTASHALARTSDGDPVAFRAGGTLLATGDDDVGPWIEYACSLAGRPLTPAEWREYVGDRPYRPTCS